MNFVIVEELYRVLYNHLEINGARNRYFLLQVKLWMGKAAEYHKVRLRKYIQDNQILSLYAYLVKLASVFDLPFTSISKTTSSLFQQDLQALVDNYSVRELPLMIVADENGTKSINSEFNLLTNYLISNNLQNNTQLEFLTRELNEKARSQIHDLIHLVLGIEEFPERLVDILLEIEKDL